MTRTCPVCGEEFETNPSRKVHKYCSKTCARRAGARRQTARKTAARKAARRPRLCVVCGTEFVPTRATNRYCSLSCRDGARNARRRGVVSGASSAKSVDLDRVRAYLALPPTERYARRKELTKAEHKLAQRIYEEDHAHRCVAVNW